MAVIQSNLIAMMLILDHLGLIVWGRNIQGFFFTVNGKIVQAIEILEKKIEYLRILLVIITIEFSPFGKLAT